LTFLCAKSAVIATAFWRPTTLKLRGRFAKPSNISQRQGRLFDATYTHPMPTNATPQTFLAREAADVHDIAAMS